MTVDLIRIIETLKPLVKLDHKAVAQLIMTFPAELQPDIAEALDYRPGMTATGWGWRIYNPRTTMNNGVSALVMNPEETHFLLERRRDKNMWGLPAGSVSHGESFEKAILREISEETGYMARILALIALMSDPEVDGYQTFPDGEQRQCMNPMYFCKVIGGDIAVSNESLDVQWFEFATWREIADFDPYNRRMFEYTGRPRETWWWDCPKG